MSNSEDYEAAASRRLLLRLRAAVVAAGVAAAAAAAAAADAEPKTIRLRICFPDDIHPESIKKVMTYVIQWFANRDCEAKYDDTNISAYIFDITGPKKHVEMLMQADGQYRIKGVDVVFREVKTTSCKEQEQQLHE